MIRAALPCDVPAITHIYNQAVRARNCTCDLHEKNLEDRTRWYQTHGNATPIFVFEPGGKVLGYAYLSAYREGRPAVATTAEVSFYVDFAAHGKGIGSALLAYAIEAAKRLGYAHLLAIVIETNVGSVALLRKFGFVEWGRLPGVVIINSDCCSHLYYGLNLFDEGDSHA